MINMRFVLTEPTGKYFLNPSYERWDFTDDVEKATTFESFEKANEMKEIIERAVAVTYWDWSDIVPFPKIKEI